MCYWKLIVGLDHSIRREAVERASGVVDATFHHARVILVDFCFGGSLDAHGIDAMVAKDNKELIAAVAFKLVWYSNHRESVD